MAAAELAETAAGVPEGNWLTIDVVLKVHRIEMVSEIEELHSDSCAMLLAEDMEGNRFRDSQIEREEGGEAASPVAQPTICV